LNKAPSVINTTSSKWTHKNLIFILYE
jgi:hypothetical protein